MERWFVRRAKAIFADNFSCAKIILLAKDGQAKIAVGNFFGAVFAPIFFETTLWAEKRSEFFGPSWAKKGVQPMALGRAF